MRHETFQPISYDQVKEVIEAHVTDRPYQPKPVGIRGCGICTPDECSSNLFGTSAVGSDEMRSPAGGYSSRCGAIALPSSASLFPKEIP
jgi:hypothetical protein